METLGEWAPGDRVWRWWDAGYKLDPQVLTVVRVNRLTITVRTDQGGVFRLPPQDLVGRWDDEQ
jgi:hypothetical protein